MDFHSHKIDESLSEFKQLALAARAVPVDVILGRRRHPDPGMFVGSGKVEEIAEAVRQHDAEIVLFNHELSPIQERNLERALSCRVVDRIGLILDIFAQRAQTFEGKLQVELAQLEHLSTRLVRGWTHLERQKGGIGLRGPGETQLETDRRLLGHRIKQINRRLEKVSRQRELRRQSRRKSDVRTVSLVGYTNAGKSTLFNCLTGAHVYEADQLFATLDPTLRQVSLPPQGHVILADTVGFVRHLPHGLVAAFRATLEETVEAGLLLHVVDAHEEHPDDQIEQVNNVLEEIGADSIMQIEIFNQIDRLDHVQPRIDRDGSGRPLRVWLSALTGDGIDLLRQVLREYLDGKWQVGDTDGRGVNCYCLRLEPMAGRLHAQLFDWDIVEGERVDENGGWLVDIRVDPSTLDYLLRQDGCHNAAIGGSRTCDGGSHPLQSAR